MFSANVSLLLTKTLVVWLKAPPETLLARIGALQVTALLNNDNPLATLAKLNKERESIIKKPRSQ